MKNEVTVSSTTYVNVPRGVRGTTLVSGPGGKVTVISTPIGMGELVWMVVVNGSVVASPDTKYEAFALATKLASTK